jgi:hypothetical protein
MQDVEEDLTALQWPVSELLLDPENPRLPEELRGSSQQELLVYIEAHYKLDELAFSMATKGYFSEEPLLVVPLAGSPGKRVVVEGNRRLATLMLLTEPANQERINKPIYRKLAAQALAEGHDLTSVAVRQYPSKARILEYLGFRHVSGIMQWEAEAKARFVHMLIAEQGYSFEKAAQTIGSRRDAIRRQFVAWCAILQARSAGVDVSPAVKRFGVFYRALQNAKVREFLHLSGWLDATPELRLPIAAGEEHRLDEFLGFIFGPNRVIRDSRQLDDLARVLADPLALEVLRQERDVSAAVREIPEDQTSLLAAMRTAYRALAEVNGQVFQFSGDERLTSEAERLARVVSLILESLRGSQGN